MTNIANQASLENYLLEKGIVKASDGHKIHYCKGGVSGTVVFLERENDTPMIVKQALAQLKTKDEWFCNPNRMNIEYESNRIYHELVPENAPDVYFYDAENYIYGREAIPEGCHMWKELLMNGALDFSVAKKSTDTLVKVHNACSTREDIKEFFENKEVFYNLRISPYFEFTVSKHPKLMAFANSLSDEIMSSSISLVHGDFSPKNIMVVGRDIKVLDYEVAHFGHPAFDLAFFSNHFILKAIKFDKYGMAYLAMLRYIVNGYITQMTYMDKREFESCFVRLLAILMLARVDGKSPVEYLVGENEKQELVRKLSYSIVDKQMETFDEVYAVLCNAVNK